MLPRRSSSGVIGLSLLVARPAVMAIGQYPTGMASTMAAALPNNQNRIGEGVERFRRILRGNDARHNLNSLYGLPLGNPQQADVPASKQSAKESPTLGFRKSCSIADSFGNDFPTAVPPRGGSSPSLPTTGAYRTAPLTRENGSIFSKPKQSRSGSGDHVVASQSETKETIDSFLTRENRNTFIARVYLILTGQLAVTSLSVVIFGTKPQLSSWVLDRGQAVVGSSLALSTFAWMFICLSPRARREAPMKWNLLALFTIGEAISVGFISSMYKFTAVISAMSATAAATMAITIYTFLNNNPKRDLSQWGSGLASFGMIFLVYGIIHLLEIFGVLPRGFLPYNDAIFSILGATLFSLYLAHHTRLIVAGKHTKYQMNEKDYVYGAMTLYNDIINMFIYLLRLIGDEDMR